MESVFASPAPVAWRPVSAYLVYNLLGTRSDNQTADGFFVKMTFYVALLVPSLITFFNAGWEGTLQGRQNVF